MQKFSVRFKDFRSHDIAFRLFGSSYPVDADDVPAHFQIELVEFSMETVYNLLGWKDFLKKRACRYLLQHYLGQFLKEKLTLDQLSIDLYNGTGTISDLELDVETLNENLNSFSIPLEIVDGFISQISVSVPWACLVQDSTQLDIHGLELTLKPKQRYHNVAPLGEMFCSMSMTSSLQLAQHCLESEKIAVDKQLGGSEKIEGVQKFAQMIDSVLTKVKVTLTNTVVRLEHIPTESEKGVALEVRIKRIEYFDEQANILMSEGTSVDGGQKNPSEPSGIANKNLKIEGLQIFFDEFNNVKVMQKCSMEPMPELAVDMSASVFGSLPEDPPEIESSQSSALPPINSEPVLVAIVTGQQELKLKLKQNDSLQGPKARFLQQICVRYPLKNFGFFFENNVDMNDTGPCSVKRKSLQFNN
ncbi:hypothetical protein ACJMK2_036669 [Sinanodonta woodiana]|uniref:Autophagy-related protein 2 n=1 Tax=Sinanodonta woodiana TaxID=1069815 RepID=A0ABD3WHX4_SINWO